MLPRGLATATHGRPTRPSRTLTIPVIQMGPKIITGDGPPSSSTGDSHDLYIDTSTNAFYGPKNPSTGWGTPLP